MVCSRTEADTVSSNPSSTPTLMAVLAHPDDESTTLGATLATYSAQGIRVVVVTCTNGEFGDRPYGVRPNPTVDCPASAATRLTELHEACRRLGVEHVEPIGFHDSGTWEGPHQHTLFCQIPVREIAARIATLIDEYRPHVVVSHDPSSTGHRDHSHAAQATRVAVATAGTPAKLYATAHGTAYWQTVRDALVRQGIRRPEPSRERLGTTDRVDEQITTTVDVRNMVGRKRHAVFAHASQIQHSLAAKVPPSEWSNVFGVDTFIRIHDSTGTPIPETDLFAGVTRP